MNNRTFNGFLKAALAFGGLRAALHSVGALESQPAAADPAARKVAAVDASCQFDSATDEFKSWLYDSMGNADVSPFLTARAMDEAAKRNGAGIQWGMFSGPALDDVGA